MDSSFYYDGTQIKNYLVGFASVFSEIPYKQRNGTLESVPIHYGSPSDIISYLEMNVDNDDTANRNRTKDISVPIFSFRMVAMERNSERRRAPLDSITVDLRPLGYSTGYVAMKPAPFKFTMELVLWASSDYQAFEITEQIVPYFNTPQQVNIEPLPRCPVSVTEIHLESFEIDTDPQAQKYSAMVTMTFSLTGWLLSQPRIWSSNMAFELSMLDKDQLTGVNLEEDYGVGHEIIDTNFLVDEVKVNDSMDSVENFIKLTSLNEIYGDKFAWYVALVEAGRISDSGELISHEELVIEYAGEEKTLYATTIDLLIDDMADVLYLYENAQLKESLETHNLIDNLTIMMSMFEDTTNTIDIFMTLFDNNLVTRGFNQTDVPITNADKLNLFGSSRIDIDDVLLRLRGYLAALENIKLQREELIALNYFNKPADVYYTELVIPSTEIPLEYRSYNGLTMDYNTHDITYKSMDYNVNTEMLNIHILKDEITEDSEFLLTVVYYVDGVITTKEVSTSVDYKNEIIFSIEIETDKLNLLNVIIDDNFNDNIQAIYINTNSETPELNTFNISAAGLSTTPKLELLVNPNLEMTSKYFKMYDQLEVINDRFINLDVYIISALIYNKFENLDYKTFEEYREDTVPMVELEYSDIYKIFTSKYNINESNLLTCRNTLKHTTDLLRENLLSDDGLVIGGDIPLAPTPPDISLVLATDNNGNPIYDVNNDGFINQTDLDILGSVVDNPEDYDYELKYGIWYKRFDIENVSEEQKNTVYESIKTIDYVSKMENLDVLKDYLVLNEKGYIIEGYNISSDLMIRREIEALGFDLEELDSKLLILRLFNTSIMNILEIHKEFVIFNTPTLTVENLREFEHTMPEIEIIVMGKLIEKYFLLITDSDERIINDELFRSLLPITISLYYDPAYKFNLAWKEITTTEMFETSLLTPVPTLDNQ